MKAHEQLDSLVSAGLVPKLFPVNSSKIMEISAFNALSDQEKEALSQEVVVVIDNHKWVAANGPVGEGPVETWITVYSGDGVLVGQHVRRKNFGVYDVNTEGLRSQSYSPLYNKSIQFKEASSMGFNNNGGDSFADLEREFNANAGAAGAGAGVQQSAAFAGAPATATAEPAKDDAGLSKEIKEALDKTAPIAKLYKLHMFNRAHGRFFGTIYSTDSRVEFGLKPVFLKGADEKPLLEAGAPEHIREEFARTGKAPTEYLQHQFKITARQAKPSKIRAIVISQPLGGMVNIMDLRGQGEVKFNDNETELRQLILDADTYASYLEMYFGGAIQESEQTHGAAARTVEVKRKKVQKFVQGSPVPTTVIQRSLKSERGSLAAEHNYFPIRTFETITVSNSTNFNDEQVRLLNRSAFNTIAGAKVKDSTQLKILKLTEEDRHKVQVSDGNITSAFFTPNANGRLSLEIRPFWDNKADFLSQIEIPVKQLVEPKDSNGTPKWKNIIYNTINDEHLNNPAVREKLSLYSPKFARFREAAKIVTLETLRKLEARAPRGGAAAKVGVSVEESIQAQFALADRALSDANLAFSDTKVDFEEINNRIFNIQVNAKAAAHSA